jgi:threonine dehydrogenase-like Zn-dependent dehydrogenase
MQALCYRGANSLAVEQVPDPVILNPHDAIIRVKLATACGSDLHLLNGYVPTMEKGDIIGHEFMGEVVETGPEVKKLHSGQRVVVVSVIGCGQCQFCRSDAWSLCDNTNPNAWVLEKAYGHSGAGIFGYSHGFGGYAGCHAEYIRVPFADHGAFPIPDSIPDEKALFVSDAFPTGYMAADMCRIQPTDTVAVWGCGAVGQMAIRSARLLGAARVIAIDRWPERLRLAKEKSGAYQTINYERHNVYEALKELTAGRGPDACIDAVGMEAHGPGVEFYYDKAKQTVRLSTDRPLVLRQMIRCCRKGGVLSVVGVYGGLIDKFPMGALMNKGLTLHTGQMHGQKYAPRLLEHLAKGDVDTSDLITHRGPLHQAPHLYQVFKNKTEGCIRPVFEIA